jgi:hypothetical protein
VVNSAATSEIGMHQKNGMSRRYSRVAPGPDVVTMSSRPNGPAVVYEYITKTNETRPAFVTAFRNDWLESFEDDAWLNTPFQQR